mgnify:CR=1 FL=1
MRKINLFKRLIMLPLLAMGFSLVASVDFTSFVNNQPEDTTVYDSNEAVTLKDFKQPLNAEESVTVNKVTIHYHNDDGKCEGRAFYVWSTGNGSGREFNPDEANSTDMSITLDFTEDNEFYKGFRGKKAMMFIIKFKRTATSANWDGQSEDIELKYEKFKENFIYISSNICIIIFFT